MNEEWEFNNGGFLRPGKITIVPEERMWVLDEKGMREVWEKSGGA